MLFAHQRSAYDTLLSRADVFFSGSWKCLGVKPRFQTLMVGPTGVGKSTIVAMVAKVLGASFHRVAANCWIPCGANGRGAKETLPEIADVLVRSKKTLLFIDEVDKIFSDDSSWVAHIQCEILDSLDGRLPFGLAPSDQCEDDEGWLSLVHSRLNENTFVVGAGTFQSFFDSRAATIRGFSGDSAPAPALPDLAVLSKFLPRELTTRFNGDLVLLRPLVCEDYRAMIGRVANGLPKDLSAVFTEIACSQVGDAVANGQGCRLIEQALLATLIRTHKPRQRRGPGGQFP